MGTFAFQLHVLHDELEARIEANHPVPGTFANAEALMEALKEENVFKGIDTEAIDKAFQRLLDLDEPGESFVIARGKPARHGKNGSIDFKVDVSGRPVYHAEDAASENGSIDYRKATHIVSVKPGDELAELVPPTQGESGFTLAGKEIKAKNGKAAILRAGEGVEIVDDGRIFKATQEGRPVFSAGTLSVNPVMVYESDIDFNTGEVKFNGHVIIKGNVQDDFSVKAKSAEIEGVVGACQITTTGPVTVRGGVNGRDRAVLQIGGAADIKYVNQARVIVKGELHVRREVINSTIWCQDKVRAEKIVGGECLALGGVEASFFGSELGVSTVIEPGANFEVRKIENDMAKVAEKIEATVKPVQIFFGERAKYKSLPDEKKAEYAQAYEQFTKLKELYLSLQQQRQEKIEDEEHQPLKQVIVRKLIYPDVFVRTDLCMKQFKRQLTGPLALIEDVDASTMRAANYVPGKGVIFDEEDED